MSRGKKRGRRVLYKQLFRCSVADKLLHCIMLIKDRTGQDEINDKAKAHITAKKYHEGIYREQVRIIFC